MRASIQWPQQQTRRIITKEATKRSDTHTCLSLFSKLGYRSYEQELGQSIASLCLNHIFPRFDLDTFAKESITQKATWTLYLQIQCW